MNEAEVTGIMAAALDARGIAYAPSESEAMALGRPYVAPAVATAPVVAPAQPVATLTPEQQIAALSAPITGNDGDAILAEAMARPADPSSYELPGIPAGQHTPEQTTLIGEMRTALHEAGFAPVIGKMVAERINAGLGSPPNDIQRAHSSAACTTALRQAWGSDYEVNLASTRAEIGRIAQKVPGVIAWLEQSGAGNDAAIIRHLHNAISARRAA